MVAPSLKSLASSLLTALPLASASVLQPQPRQQQGSVGRPWISFDAEGHSSTYSRTVTTINGAATTISAQPYSLTGSVYTLIDPTGATYTTTGTPPPPRATDSSGGRGYFAVCLEGSNSNVQPFCQPRNNATLYADTPYYITWDTRAFSADLDTPVHIQLFNVSRDGSNPISDNSDVVPLRTLGFDNETKLSQGYYVFTPTESDLNGNNDFQNLTLRIAFNSSTGGGISNRTGATIVIRPEDMMPRDVPITDNDDNDDNEDEDSGSGGGGGPPAAAIAVPIVVVVLAVIGIGAFFLIRKRRREQGAGAGVPNRGSSAFGSRASGGSAQFNQKNNNDIELTTSPTSPRGGNVFQEEIERQNRERAV